MNDRPALVHGATGFTGRLVCEALRRRGIPFAISGRSADKLDALAASLGGDVERFVVDAGDPDALRAAIEGRSIVCACAGPFAQIGEPLLATCARLGVHYADTTGEQVFVASALRYRATAEASGACIVPALAYEIAPADWGAHLAAQAAGGAPDAIAIAYAVTDDRGRPFGTTRGTKKSALGMIAGGESKQWVDGALVSEAPASIVRRFGDLTAVSFPSPEAVVVPSHTGARTVRTFLATGAVFARAARATRAVAPSFARATRTLLERAIDRLPEGPDELARRASRFRVVCEASKGARVETVVVSGADPYGLTAEIQAYAVERARAGAIRARGVVAPSVAFEAREALAALEPFGVRVDLKT